LLGLLDLGATVWAKSEERKVTVCELVSGPSLKIVVEPTDSIVRDLQARATAIAYHMVVLVSGNLIHEVLLGIQGRLDDSVAGQELECAVDRRLCQSACATAGPGEDLSGGEVGSRFEQDMQDRQALGGDPEPEGSEAGGVVNGAGHEWAYCK
jgi:hypothetical protein